MAKEVIGGKLMANGVQVPVSKAVRAGDFVFVSGQLAFQEDGTVLQGDTSEQTKKVLENISNILSQAGCTMDDIVKCTCWISDANNFNAFNTAYAEYFGQTPPARSCIPSSLLLGAKVEVEAIAYKPQ